MDNFQEQQFDAPIPGMSMTAELGARPWQQPPRFSTVEQTTSHYIESMSSEEFSDKLIDVLEMGVPVTTIADVMMMNGTMDGTHSADIGILIMPILVEFMLLIADSSGIEYTSGLEEEDTPSKAAIARAVDKFKKEKASNQENKGRDMQEEGDQFEAVVENTEQMPQEDKPVGLMARRA